MNTAMAYDSTPQIRRIIEGDLEIIPSACHVAWKGNRVDITPTRMKVLMLLAERKGLAVSHAELYRTFRPAGFCVGDGPDAYRRNVATFVKRLRRAFEAVDPSFDRIETQSGFGYRWRA